MKVFSPICLLLFLLGATSCTQNNEQYQFTDNIHSGDILLVADISGGESGKRYKDALYVCSFAQKSIKKVFESSPRIQVARWSSLHNYICCLVSEKNLQADTILLLDIKKKTFQKINPGQSVYDVYFEEEKNQIAALTQNCSILVTELPYRNFNILWDSTKFSGKIGEFVVPGPMIFHPKEHIVWTQVLSLSAKEKRFIKVDINANHAQVFSPERTDLSLKAVNDDGSVLFSSQSEILISDPALIEFQIVGQFPFNELVGVMPTCSSFEGYVYSISDVEIIVENITSKETTRIPAPLSIGFISW